MYDEEVLEDTVKAYFSKWSALRQAQGWTRGPSFDHDFKITPMLTSNFEDLPFDDREFFRAQVALVLASYDANKKTSIVFSKKSLSTEKDDDIVSPATNTVENHNKRTRVIDTETIISTNLLYPDLTPVKVIVTPKKKPKKFRISDEGAGFAWLQSYMKGRPRGKKQNKVINEMCNPLGVTIRRGALVKDVKTEGEIDRAVLDVAQSVIHAVDARITYRPPNKEYSAELRRCVDDEEDTETSQS